MSGPFSLRGAVAASLPHSALGTCSDLGCPFRFAECFQALTEGGDRRCLSLSAARRTAKGRDRAAVVAFDARKTPVA